MPGETKTDPKTEDWKNLKVSNTGKTWQDLHDFVVRQHKNFGIDENGRDKSGDRGNFEGAEKARKAHDLLRTHEQFHNVSDDKRIHRTAFNGFGPKYINTTPADKYDTRQIRTRNEQDVVYLGGKKRKTKRKKRKTKRKKKTRKRKRRRKTKERKRRKKRKTRKR
ncbi:hypothetical protein N9P79_02610 [Crocinitomicaceae bacterium]|nr:hypothetical protein [Crocinitomicaceae bacterium]